MIDELQASEPASYAFGAVIRLFGVILIILGTLNTMLSWRGGFELLSLPVYLLGAGALLCVIGGILRGPGPGR